MLTGNTEPKAVAFLRKYKMGIKRRYALLVWSSLASLLLLTGDAYAFGPVTHVHLGCQVLGSLGLLAPPLARLLKEHAHEFLYGTMAADVIIAKNLADSDKHCHNWDVGFSVLRDAKTEAEQAFAWGYLCHLAGDVIAHNYFVPWKLVQGFSARTTGHAYWEIRLDQKAPSESWGLIHTLGRQAFPDQHGLLARTIEGTIFRFETNLTIFNGMLFVQRMKRWRALLDRVESRSKWTISDDETHEIKTLAYEAMMDLLLHREKAQICQIDPTGIPNLHIAKQMRRSLRRARFRRKLNAQQIETVIKRVRMLYREGVHEPFRANRWPEDLKNLQQLSNDGGDDELENEFVDELVDELVDEPRIAKSP